MLQPGVGGAATSGQRSGILLNIQQSRGHIPTEQAHEVHDVSDAKVEKPKIQHCKNRMEKEIRTKQNLAARW